MKAAKGETFTSAQKENCNLLQQVNQMRDSIRSAITVDHHNSSRLSVRSHLTNETSLFANNQMSYLQILSKAIRSTATKEFRVSEINQHNDDYDSDELKHYCHSDADDFQDPDPFFEYNKCHMCSFLQKKVEDPIYIYEPVRISNTFGLPSPVFEEPKTNITVEVEQITRQKFYKTMEKLVLPEKCIDKAEEALFKDYVNSSVKLGETNLAAEYMSTVHNPSMFPLEKK